jgi:hypothetical protein
MLPGSFGGSHTRLGHIVGWVDFSVQVEKEGLMKGKQHIFQPPAASYFELPGMALLSSPHLYWL